MGASRSSRRQFLLGSAAGAVAIASGCAHRGAAGGTPAAPPAAAPSSSDLPQYTQLRAPVGPEIAPALAQAEASPLLMAQADHEAERLRQAPLRPSPDQPLFVAIGDRRGPLTFAAPSGQRCVPVFTSPVTAADYVRLLLHDLPTRPSYLFLTATQLGNMCRVIEAAVARLALDRCPRCPNVMTVPVNELASADRAIGFWAIVMGVKRARLALYLSFARKACDEGHLELARDTALATVAHVTSHDEAAHQLLRELAPRLGDATLQREAEAYLAYLRNPHV